MHGQENGSRLLPIIGTALAATLLCSCRSGIVVPESLDDAGRKMNELVAVAKPIGNEAVRLPYRIMSSLRKPPEKQAAAVKIWHVPELDSRSFKTEVLKSGVPVVVDFYHDHCPPCKRYAPVFETLSGEFGKKVKFLKFNLYTPYDARDTPKQRRNKDAEEDRRGGIKKKYRVDATPTTLVFLKGKVIGRIEGFRGEPEGGSTTRDELIKLIEEKTGIKPMAPL